MNPAATLDAPPSNEEIRAHLSQILESPQFRSSKRAQHLLTFLVERTIEGRQDILKERVIGVEVFNRPTDYNPASDPIVRVSAGELRKRLAQYYQESLPGIRALRIRVITGHYVPEFSWAQSPPPPVELPPYQTPPQRHPWRKWAVVGVASMLLLVLGIYVRPSNSLDRFWGPAFHSRHAPLVLSERYGSGSIMHRFNAELKLRTEPVASTKLLANDIAATLGQAVMFGNVFAIRSLDLLFSANGLKPELRIGGAVNTSELADRPVVLIGYFNNPWAKNVNSEKTRFTLSTERRGDLYVHSIVDRVNPTRQWSITSDRLWFENTPVSYVIVTRIFDRGSGRFMVSIAGMTHLGTAAAAEFLTRQSYLDELQRQAPSGWEKMNAQAVLQTNIVDETAAPPKLVASHFW